ncbi:MAG: ATP-grasp domain-containing protein [Pirellulaceae bacterium]|nr:ATP-grasp domain-containing protein [Pirellulaceae bacterium]
MSGQVTILGASARGAAGSAARAGWRVHAIDLFGDEDLRELATTERIARFPRDFVAALGRAPEAPWIYTGGLENQPNLVARLARLRPLWGNGSAALRGVRDPSRLARVFHAAGLAYPEVRAAGETVRDGPGEPWLLKPLRGSAGLGVREATEIEAPIPRGHFAQRYIAGTATSAVFVAAAGAARLVGATRQVIGRDWGLALPYLYVGSIGPLALLPYELAMLARLGNVLAAEFSLVGLFNVDLVHDGQTWWTIEVNPRYSASVEVLERGTGEQLFAWHVAACERGMLPDDAEPVSTPKMAGKAVVYARADGIATARLAALVHDWNRNREWPLVADVPATGLPLQAGQPVVTVFAAGNSAKEVETELRRRANEVLAAVEM